MDLPTEHIIAIGDTHGDWSNVRALNHKHTNSTFIHVGDCGIGYHTPVYDLEILTKLADLLTKQGNKLLCIRGNHDDPSYFDDLIIGESIQLVKDNQVIRVGNKDVLFIGGAISIDRTNSMFEGRKKGKKLYWPDETVKIDFNKIETYANVDVVVTHTAPWCAPPQHLNNRFVLDWIRVDPALEEELKAERESLSQLKRALLAKFDIELWMYGHFHNRVTFEHDDITFECFDCAQSPKPFAFQYGDITERMLSDKRTLP